MNLERIVRVAIAKRTKHFALGRPMRESQGFREAIIAHDLSGAFQQKGFSAFPEFPFGRGSIDAVFVRNTEVVVCEWKRLYPRSIPRIANQTKRMLAFDPQIEMAKHGFKRCAWSISRLWVCDSWSPASVEWWQGRPSQLTSQRPFDRSWKCGAHAFGSLAPEWDPYFWVWAYQTPPSRFEWQDVDIQFIASGPKLKAKAKKGS